MNAEEIKKIEQEETTSNTSNDFTISGADPALVDKANTSFSASSNVTQLEDQKNNALTNFENIAGKDKLVSDSTWDTINQNFKTPAAVKKADSYLKGQLSKIQSGKTSYSDQVRDMMSQIQNREKFSYDVDSDPLFQQALASAMNSGKSAMQDTIGQASALTGGYGSSYATSAANQAYNSFIEDAYDNLPQYYQMALEAYQMEGDEMYRQLDMLNTADATEYGRLLNAYDATYAHRNQMYNEAYQQFRDTKADAIAGANLALSEHGQLVNDAFNLYSAYSNEANTAYNREYQQWMDSINQAMQMIGLQNQDYWADKNYQQTDEHFYKGLEHESNENALNREHQATENQKDRDHQSNENALNREHQATENQKDRDHQSNENALNRTEEQRQFNITHGDTSGDGKLSADEIAAYNAKEKEEAQQGLGLSGTEYDKFLETLKTKGEDAACDYLDLIGKGPVGDEQEDVVANIISRHKEEKTAEATAPLDWNSVEIRKTKETINGGWGHDHNDEFYVDGDIMTLDDIKEKLTADGWSGTKLDSFLQSLSDIKKDETYSFNGGLKKK